jgi:hypothetical protein
LYSKKCHDDLFAVGANAKFWTCLLDNGTKAGGQEEKLDYCVKRGHNHTAKHLKGGLYRGKFADVQHSQIVFSSSRNRGGQEIRTDRQIDTRQPFDCRLKDDMLRYNEDIDREHAQANLDVMRPSHTRSCPELGVDFMFR